MPTPPAIGSLRLLGLPPIANAHTRVLVLGSFPGAASLAAQQYYGHPRNHFWPIIETILASSALFDSTVCYVNSDSMRTAPPTLPTTYADRCQWLLAHGVGVWDVYASCQRQGSLDASIRHATVNDFAGLLQRCPQLRLVVHNGAESFKHAHHLAALGLPAVKLPSTSPANASCSLTQKKAAWLAALGPALAA